MNRLSKDVSTMDHVIPDYFFFGLSVFNFDGFKLFLSVLILLWLTDRSWWISWALWSLSDGSIIGWSYQFHCWFIFPTGSTGPTWRLPASTDNSSRQVMNRIEFLLTFALCFTWIGFSSALVHLSSTLNGLPTLRAHRRQSFFQRVFHAHLDAYNTAFYVNMTRTQWFSIRLNLLCVAYSLFVTFSCLAMRGGMIDDHRFVKSWLIHDILSHQLLAGVKPVWSSAP